MSNFHNLTVCPFYLRELEETASPLVKDYAAKSDRMLIAFGGIKGFRAIPPYEFWNITREIEVKKIFVRDFSQAWYQAGLPGIASDVDSMAKFLKAEVRSQNVRHLTLLGNSMGGYAALLFGNLLEADTSIAIAPQTFLNQVERLRHLDFRWFRQMCQAQKYNHNPQHLNLKELLRTPRTHQDLQVHYNGFFDSAHAHHLRDCANVRLIHHPDGGHDLVRHLRKNGQLKQIILNAIQ